MEPQVEGADVDAASAKRGREAQRDEGLSRVSPGTGHDQSHYFSDPSSGGSSMNEPPK